MKKHTTLLSAGLLLFAWTSCKAPFNAAEQRLSEGQYQLAINGFMKALDDKKNESKKGKIYHHIAECYRLSNRPAEAKEFYQKALAENYSDSKTGFWYAYSLKSNAEYDLATAEFEKYSKSGADAAYMRRAKEEFENMRLVKPLLDEKTLFQTKNCEALNSGASDFSPIVFNDKLLFTSGRRGEKIYKATGKGFLDLYEFKFTSLDSCAGLPSFFTDRINLDGMHEASATFSKDGKTMIFARSNSGKKKEDRTEVDLYETVFDGNTWSEPTVLSFCNPRHWDSCPAFSGDGETLYFASNRPGGEGGIDLYRVKKEEGEWGKPFNLGKKINTKGNEMFPAVTTDGTLYFASDGHPGLGGLDIFKAVKEDKIITIKNLATPINSSADDFGLVFREDKKGYFASNRSTDGSKGDDDIFAFEIVKPEVIIKTANYYLSGIVFEKKDGKQEYMKGVDVSLLDKEGKELAKIEADKDGKFKFDVKLDTAASYFIKGAKKEYLEAKIPFSLEGKKIDPYLFEKTETDTTMTVELVLIKNLFEDLDKGKPNSSGIVEIELKNILYDYDKWDIKTESGLELDKLAEYLKARTEVKVELGSHTDIRGDTGYNERLSQKRADSAVAYIISKGIDKSRIIAKGYGESNPKVKNARTEADHQQNRRTTVRIVE